ncbi:ParB N-terminal domain-containing protein [Oscillatoria sp. CS-180]|uniref:ParB/RepB/Spo0J family partition protein n=1 Tax=Oscillatoria sp. CS-180 TaxID=3021720 RepID=UPI00232D9291|nr:ParB N-terminal domain-containing protein [Oscillatoria sp. CS-180]MDB9526294.1 ParB N-terminal domain-containing protein [Oscillatoria sp. CS-180]
MAKFGKSGWNNAKISSVVQKPVTNSKQEVPISRIRKGRWQPRSYAAEDHINQLVASFTEHGFSGSVPVIEVFDDPEHDYEFIGGHTTAEALQRIGRTAIAVDVQQVESDLKLAEFSYQHNAASRPLNALDDTNSILTIIQEHFQERFNYRPNVDELAKLFSQIRRKVSKVDQQKVAAIEEVWERNKLPITISSFSSSRIPLISLSPELKEAIVDESISPNIAIEIGKIKNTTERHTLLEKAVHNEMTVVEVKEAVKGISESTQSQAQNEQEKPAPVHTWKQTYQALGKRLRKIDFDQVPIAKQSELLEALERVQRLSDEILKSVNK